VLPGMGTGDGRGEFGLKLHFGFYLTERASLDKAREGFEGERPEHHMKKTRVEHPKVSCGTCRMFDGTAWCRHWNFHTTAESPPCRFYKAVPSAPSS